MFWFSYTQIQHVTETCFFTFRGVENDSLIHTATGVIAKSDGRFSGPAQTNIEWVVKLVKSPTLANNFHSFAAFCLTMKTVDAFGHIEIRYYRTGYELADYFLCYQFDDLRSNLPTKIYCDEQNRGGVVIIPTLTHFSSSRRPRRFW